MKGPGQRLIDLAAWAVLGVTAALWVRDVRKPALAAATTGRVVSSLRHFSPSDWRVIALSTAHEVRKDRLTTVAGSVTFSLLLAIFPTLAVFVSLYGLFADITTVAIHLALLSQILPPGAVELLAEQMIRVAMADQSSLSAALVLSLLFALWSANSGVGALFGGLNAAYGLTERRPWWRLNLISLAGTLCGLMALTLLAAITGAAPAWLQAHGMMTSDVLRVAAGEVLLFIVITSGLAALYRFGPSHQGRNWRCYWPGALLAAVLWLAASVAYSTYVNNFAHYEKTYGSLGAIVGFMMWLWLSSLAILTGAELNAEIEKRASVET